MRNHNTQFSRNHRCHCYTRGEARGRIGLPAPCPFDSIVHCPTLNELIESDRSSGSEVEVVLGEVVNNNNAKMMVMLMLNRNITMLLRLRLQSLLRLSGCWKWGCCCCCIDAPYHRIQALHKQHIHTRRRTPADPEL